MFNGELREDTKQQLNKERAESPFGKPLVKGRQTFKKIPNICKQYIL